MPARGSNRRAVDTHITALRREQQLDTHGEALAALARKLADLLDVGEPVMMTASWARELRQTLDALTPGGDSGDGDDDDSWVAGLPSPLRHAEN